MSSLICGKIRHHTFPLKKAFIDDLYAINDGGEFGRSFNVIYPKEFEVKAYVRYFMSNFCFFHQMIALQKL